MVLISRKVSATSGLRSSGLRPLANTQPCWGRTPRPKGDLQHDRVQSTEPPRGRGRGAGFTSSQARPAAVPQSCLFFSVSGASLSVVNSSGRQVVMDDLMEVGVVGGLELSGFLGRGAFGAKVGEFQMSWVGRPPGKTRPGAGFWGPSPAVQLTVYREAARGSGHRLTAVCEPP